MENARPSSRSSRADRAAGAEEPETICLGCDKPYSGERFSLRPGTRERVYHHADCKPAVLRKLREQAEAARKAERERLRLGLPLDPLAFQPKRSTSTSPRDPYAVPPIPPVKPIEMPPPPPPAPKVGDPLYPFPLPTPPRRRR